MQLVGRVQKRFGLALAVNIDEQIADLLERGENHRLIVGVGMAAAIAVEPSGQDDLVVIERASEDVPRFHGAVSGEVELKAAGDAQLLRAGAEQVRGAASPRSKPSAPSNSDLPAPVSPVQAQKPGCSSTRTSSIRARFCTDNSRSIVDHLTTAHCRAGNPKSEIRNPKELQMKKSKKTKQDGERFGILDIVIWAFFRISSFGFPCEADAGTS